MIPTPIPDDEIWFGAERKVFGPPGDITGDIRAVEGLIDRTSDGTLRISMRLVPEPGELERLAIGEPMWLSFLGNHLHPFNVSAVQPE